MRALCLLVQVQVKVKYADTNEFNEFKLLFLLLTPRRLLFRKPLGAGCRSRHHHVWRVVASATNSSATISRCALLASTLAAAAAAVVVAAAAAE